MNEIELLNIIHEDLTLLHSDLGILVCFIVFFVLVIILVYSYKFFNMMFKF